LSDRLNKVSQEVIPEDNYDSQHYKNNHQWKGKFSGLLHILVLDFTKVFDELIQTIACINFILMAGRLSAITHFLEY